MPQPTYIASAATFLIAGRSGSPGQVIRLAQDVQINETFDLMAIRGIGDLRPQTLQAVAWSGSGSLTLMQNGFTGSDVPEFLVRDFLNQQDFDRWHVHGLSTSFLILFGRDVSEPDENNSTIPSYIPIGGVAGLKVADDGKSLSDRDVLRSRIGYQFTHALIANTASGAVFPADFAAPLS